VFQREQFGEFVDIFVDHVDESHHHPRPTLRIKGGPPFLCCDGDRNGGVDLRCRCHGHLRLHPTRAGIQYVDRATGPACSAPAIDGVRNPVRLGGH
jgi:hypothetical protein